MAEVGGTVSTSFQTRSINSDISSGQDAARTVANSAINAVDDVLDALKDEGATALDDALAAITALGDFSPGTITFSYTIPDYLPTEFALPDKFVAGTNEVSVVEPETGAFSLTFDAPQLVDIGDVPPPEFEAQLVTAPSAQPVAGFPVAPVIDELLVGDAPELGSGLDINIDTVVAPSLSELALPIFSASVLPKYEAAELSADIDAQAQALLDALAPPTEAITRYKRGRSAKTFWKDYVGDNIRMFTKANTPAPLPTFKWVDVLGGREVTLGTDAWEARGWKLDTAANLAQKEYRLDMARLAATKERNMMAAGQLEINRLSLLKQAEARIKESNSDGYLNVVLLTNTDYELASLCASSNVEAFRLFAALYSAKIAAFNLEVMQYKASLSAALSKLEQWKILIKAETGKASLNDTLVRLYSASVDAQATAGAVYESEVRIMGAEIDAYKARMQAFATQAEVARTKLSVYKGTVDAYVGSLSGYKAQFAQYEARMKGTAAENRVQEAKTQVSMAQISAASANSVQASVDMEVKSAALRLQARAQGALFDNQKLLNSLETIKAQIAADTAKQSIAEWSANIQLTNVENDAIGAEAQAAARYFQVASDSAYRASEQALRAMMSASQAANIAQESGSRAAASIAQGAYSAMHVNASLTGSGRVSGDESQDARRSSVISDYLDYSEDRQQILSA